MGGGGTLTKVRVLDIGALNPIVSVSMVEGWWWRPEVVVVVGSEETRSDELTGGSGSEEDGGPAGSVSDSEGIGAVDVTGAGGAAREVEEEEEEKEEEDSAGTVEVSVDSSEEAAEVMGGAPDTAEVLDGDWEADMLELSGLGDSDEIKEVVVVAAVAEDGGISGEPIEGVVRVSEDDGASDVPSGLSGSLVTVTQSVTDMVLLLASWILEAPLSSVE